METAKRVQFVGTKAGQLGISYVVFQMLMFASVARSSSLSCNQLWIPLSLSLLVAALFGPAFAIAVREWSRARYELDLNMVYRRMLSEPDMFREYKRCFLMWVLGCALLAYTFLILKGSYVVLCDNGVVDVEV